MANAGQGSLGGPLQLVAAGNAPATRRGCTLTAAAGRPGGSPRRLLSHDDLLARLNERLAIYGHCDNCRFVGPIRRLDEPAEDGRNWSRFIPLVCSDQTPSGCNRIAERILDDAVAEYNLIAPS